MNKLAIVAAALLLFFGAMLWFLASADWNGFIRSQIEIQGSKLTGQPVTVDKVELSLTEGFGGIYGVSFNNPGKYAQKNAFYLGEVSLGIDVSSLTKSPIVVRTIALKKPQVFVEFDEQGNSNINDLLTAINSNIPKSEGGTAEPEPAPPKKPKKDAKPQPKIAINSLELTGVALTLDLTKVNGKVIDVEIPSVQLESIGGTTGIDADKLGAVIGKDVFSAISDEVKKQYKLALKEKLDKKKQDLLDKLKKKNNG